VKAFHQFAFFLVKCGLRPNQVSILSSVFAILGGISLLLASRSDGAGAKILLLVGGLLGIQLRLLCNLTDGLMAVEGGKKTLDGEFFNDFPDRISDVVLLLFVGYSLAGPAFPAFAWAASLGAVLTAYIRVLGSSMGAPHYFLGPMAKQHRMAVLNLGVVGSCVEVLLWGTFQYSLAVAIVVILFGTLVTCVRRANALLAYFRAKPTVIPPNSKNV
jgi:phosphatidylglycerophosphate synthase